MLLKYWLYQISNSVIYLLVYSYRDGAKPAVEYNTYVSMSSHCKGTHWSTLCQPPMHTSGCYDRGNIQSVRKRCMVLFFTQTKGTTAWEGGGTSPWMVPTQHAMGKSIQDLSNVAWKQASQNGKDGRLTFHMYSSFYSVLLSHWVLGLPHRNPGRILSPPSTPAWNSYFCHFVTYHHCAKKIMVYGVPP